MNALSQAVAGRRVVLGHDWLTGMRGGERVLELMCKSIPDAPLVTLIHTAGAVNETIGRHPIHTSWLQSVPGIAERYRLFLPLMPHAAVHLRVPDAELMLTTSHCVAKSFRPPAGCRHLCYCFTPMRYAWTFYEEYFGTNPYKAICIRPVLAALRHWDRKSCASVDRFVAISRHVQERIQRSYGRESDVVYPPVDTQRCVPAAMQTASGGYDLVVSALVPYKRIDLAVKAYTKSGFPLKVVGTGSGMAPLRKGAGSNIQFLGWRADEEVLGMYQRCRLLVFPGEEDFGIVPLEAQACGRPVVAYGRGGALETIVADETGVFFEEQTPEALLAAVERCAARRWDVGAIRAHAERFGHAAFIEGLAACVRGLT